MRRFLLPAAVLAALVIAHRGEATTPIPLGFVEMTQGAALVVQGTVTDLRTIATGSQVRRTSQNKRTRSPSSDPTTPGSEPISEPTAVPAKSTIPPSPPEAPVGVGVKRGRMMFTEVTLAVEEEIVGSTAGTVTFTIAGGSDGEQVLAIGGMPTFDLGQRYIVFLRPGYQTTAAPIMGVNQGFFRVVQQQVTGSDIVLDAASDIVLGVEADRVVVRHNPDRDTPREPKIAELPVPGPGGPARATVSPEVQRYWGSRESSITPADFVATIRSARGNAP